MKKNAEKNCMVFFGGAIARVIAVFIFSIVLVNISFSTPHAHAYAIGSVAPDATPGAGTDNYNAGNSLQNLISPFTGFINNLKWNSDTTISPGSQAPSFPTVNLTPVLESGVQNTISQWFNEFDNWFYGLTGVRLSGILLVLLNAILWTLGLAQKVVEWLLYWDGSIK